MTALRTPLEKAKSAWGKAMPAEVSVLAKACAERSAKDVARLIGYSAGAVSNVIANKYRGDLSAVCAKIRGALMGETVNCPVLGEIGRDRCMQEQRTPFHASNSTRARLFHACKTCPNNHKSGEAS
jgi:hypothetical protein